jgi:hypothetical protein
MVMSGMVQWLLEQVSNQWKAGYEIYTSKQNEIKEKVAEQPDPNQEFKSDLDNVPAWKQIK